MEILTEWDSLQEAMKKVDLSEDTMVFLRGKLVTESAAYDKMKLILNCPEMQKSHAYLYNLDPEQLSEDEIENIDKLYNLGTNRGFIKPDEECKDCSDDQDLKSQSLEVPEDKPVQSAISPMYQTSYKPKIPCWTILYSACDKNGDIKTGECYSNAINPRSAKADCYGKLERCGYTNISILALEAGDPDSCGSDEISNEERNVESATEDRSDDLKCENEVNEANEDALNEYSPTRLPKDRVEHHATGIPVKYYVAVDEYDTTMTGSEIQYVDQSLNLRPSSNNNLPSQSQELNNAISIAKRAIKKWPMYNVGIMKDDHSFGWHTRKNHLRGGIPCAVWIANGQYWDFRNVDANETQKMESALYESDELDESYKSLYDVAEEKLMFEIGDCKQVLELYDADSDEATKAMNKLQAAYTKAIEVAPSDIEVSALQNLMNMEGFELNDAGVIVGIIDESLKLGESGNPYSAGMKMSDIGGTTSISSKGTASKSKKKEEKVNEDDEESSEESSDEESSEESSEEESSDEESSEEESSDEESSDEESSDEESSEESSDEESSDEESSDEESSDEESSDEESSEESSDEESSEESSDEESSEESSDEESSDEELSDEEKSQLKSQYKKLFKDIMIKCKFEDKSFDDLSIKEKVVFFTKLNKEWNKNEPKDFMSDKEIDQLNKIVIKKD